MLQINTYMVNYCLAGVNGFKLRRRRMNQWLITWLFALSLSILYYVLIKLWIERMDNDALVHKIKIISLCLELNYSNNFYRFTWFTVHLQSRRFILSMNFNIETTIEAVSKLKTQVITCAVIYKRWKQLKSDDELRWAGFIYMEYGHIHFSMYFELAKYISQPLT